MRNDRWPGRCVVRVRWLDCRGCALWLVLAAAACATPPPPEAGRAVSPPVGVDSAPPISVPAPAPAPALTPDGVAATDPAPDPAPLLTPIDEDSNIFFALRSAQIDAAGQQKLRAIADRLAGNRRARVLLIGHGDGQGSRSYDIALTEERLAAVGRMLRGYGVGVHQIRRNRVGSVRSVPACKDEACWRLVRRVELVVTP